MKISMTSDNLIRRLLENMTSASLRCLKVKFGDMCLLFTYFVSYMDLNNLLIDFAAEL